MKPTMSKLLDLGGRILGTDLRYTLSGAFFLAFSQVIGALVSFALTVAFANLLPIAAYGTYRYVLAAYAIFAIASLPGIDTAVMQSVSRGKEGTFLAALCSKLRWSLLGTALTIAYAAYLFANGELIIALLFVIAALALPAMEAFSLYSAYFNGKRAFKEWAFFEIISQLVSAAALIGTMFVTANILAVMLAYFAPYALSRAIGTWWILKRDIENSEIDPEFSRFGRSVTLYQIITKISASIDQIVLYHFLGPAQVAIYSLAMAIPNRAQGIFKISGILAFPKFANRNGQDVAQTLPRKMIFFAILILGACALYVIVAPHVFSLLFPKYMESLAYSQAAIFFTLSAITYPFSSFLFAHKRLAGNYIASTSGFIAKVCCLVVFVPIYGIWGAIIGVLASALVIIVTSITLLVRERFKADV